MGRSNAFEGCWIAVTFVCAAGMLAPAQLARADEAFFSFHGSGTVAGATFADFYFTLGAVSNLHLESAGQADVINEAGRR